MVENKKRICIDLDGVICTLRKHDEGYEKLKPVPGAVNGIKDLRDSGYYIIIYTARRMKTHSANVGKILADVGKVTLDWLDKYDIPYDEIHFGKPWADVYIDDNAYRFESWDQMANDGYDLPVSHEVMVRGHA
jgi:capsule biosynthesis phosphatase